jgi:hypothetical protein
MPKKIRKRKNPRQKRQNISSGRKNPFPKVQLEELPLLNREIEGIKLFLLRALLRGSSSDLMIAIKIVKTGGFCLDCGNYVDSCYCEACVECKLQECKCKYGLHVNDIDSDKVRNITWGFAKKLLNRDDLIQFRKKVLEYAIPKDKSKLEKIMVIKYA